MGNMMLMTYKCNGAVPNRHLTAHSFNNEQLCLPFFCSFAVLAARGTSSQAIPISLDPLATDSWDQLVYENQFRMQGSGLD